MMFMMFANKSIKYSAISVAVVLVIAGAIWQLYFASPVSPNFVSKDDLIKVTSPLPGDVISSPLIVEGEARGNWFFEASFPLVLVDWDGRIIAQSYALTAEEWMTTEYVSFRGTIEFPASGGESPVFPGAGKDHFSRRGAVIFQKDNPSGLPEHENALEIPVVFGQ